MRPAGPAAHWPEVERLFDQAADLPAGERSAFLDSKCPPALRAEVDSLLRALDGSAGFLEAPPPAPAIAELPAGTLVGAWRLLKLIGRGGMSEVYLAERADGQYRQEVAVKLISSALAGKAARFEAERQLLAQLDHPGIARLLDGGVAPDGRPFMAMEFVEGRNLVEHCRASAATLDARLSLFMAVCEAVGYAHRRLVVHCDLKPGNILVTAEGRVKLLDFGIATVLGAGDGGEARTQHLTPGYAAPEQLEGAALTTATDVYALGAILYELLAGEPPFRLSTQPLAAALQSVLYRAPAPMSGSASGPVPARSLRGDLDAIAAKALRKEPDARYATAAGLHADLERHRRNEPVTAREPALGYLLRSFARRYRALTAAVAIATLALVTALAVSLAFYVEARRARDRAQTAAETAQAVNDFLNQDLLAAAQVTRGPTRDVKLRELLDSAAAKAGERFSGKPEAEAKVREAIGDSYYNLSAYQPAYEQYLRSRELLRSAPGIGAPALLALTGKLAVAAGALFRYEEAGRLYDEAIAGNGAPGGDLMVRAQLRVQKADLLHAAGWFETATRELQALVEDRAVMEHLSEEDRFDARARYGGLLAWNAEYDEALRQHRLALDGRLRLHGADHIATAVSQLGLGSVLVDAGKIDEAATLIDAGLATMRRWVGPDDAFLAMAESTAAKLRSEQGRHAEAQLLVADALRIRDALFGVEASYTAWTRTQMADILHRASRLEEALALSTTAVGVADRVDGRDNPWTVRQRLVRVALLRELGRRQEASAELAVIKDEAFVRLPPRHPFRAQLRIEQGREAMAAGDRMRARAALAEALDIYTFRFGPAHWRTREVKEELEHVGAAVGREGPPRATAAPTIQAISRNSHALALTQSRRTVRPVIPSSCAVSSSV